MDGFKFFGEGRLARPVELTRHGDTIRARFALINNTVLGTDTDTGERRERATALECTAFGGLAETIAAHTRKGDQLVIFGRIGNNNWVDDDGAEHYDFNFVVEEFGFGAPGKETRDVLAQRAGKAVDMPAATG